MKKLFLIFCSLASLSSCDPSCGSGQLWISNEVDQTFNLYIPGRYDGPVAPGEVVKLTFEGTPQVVTYYINATESSKLVEDCGTTVVEII